MAVAKLNWEIGNNLNGFSSTITGALVLSDRQSHIQAITRLCVHHVCRARIPPQMNWLPHEWPVHLPVKSKAQVSAFYAHRIIFSWQSLRGVILVRGTGLYKLPIWKYTTKDKKKLRENEKLCLLNWHLYYGHSEVFVSRFQSIHVNNTFSGDWRQSF